MTKRKLQVNSKGLNVGRREPQRSNRKNEYKGSGGGKKNKGGEPNKTMLRKTTKPMGGGKRSIVRNGTQLGQGLEVVGGGE